MSNLHNKVFSVHVGLLYVHFGSLHLRSFLTMPRRSVYAKTTAIVYLICWQTKQLLMCTRLCQNVLRATTVGCMFLSTLRFQGRLLRFAIHFILLYDNVFFFFCRCMNRKCCVFLGKRFWVYMDKCFCVHLHC